MSIGSAAVFIHRALTSNCGDRHAPNPLRGMSYTLPHYRLLLNEMRSLGVDPFSSTDQTLSTSDREVECDEEVHGAPSPSPTPTPSAVSNDPHPVKGHDPNDV